MHFKVTRVNKEFKFEVIDKDLYSMGKNIPTTQMHGGATYALDAIVKPPSIVVLSTPCYIKNLQNSDKFYRSAVLARRYGDEILFYICVILIQ